MLIIIVILADLALLAILYMRLRPWLRAQFPALYARLGWLDGYWARSETWLAGRVLQLGGWLVTIHDSLALMFGALDWTPVTGRVLAWAPPDLRPLLVAAAVALLGHGVLWLRTTATRPLQNLE